MAWARPAGCFGSSPSPSSSVATCARTYPGFNLIHGHHSTRPPVNLSSHASAECCIKPTGWQHNCCISGKQHTIAQRNNSMMQKWTGHLHGFSRGVFADINLRNGQSTSSAGASFFRGPFASTSQQGCPLKEPKRSC